MILYLKDQCMFFILFDFLFLFIHFLIYLVLEMDNSGCLRRLLNYPPVEDVTIFITSALNLIEPARAKKIAKVKPQPVSAKIEELFVPNQDNSPEPKAVHQNPMVITSKLKKLLLLFI